ncbi:MAG: triose-phosphate isomerase [Pseudomonadota bacterium]
MRRMLVAGNWKMHGDLAGVDELLKSLLSALPQSSTEVLVCPTYVHLSQALALCANADVAVGAQDCSHADRGAYTGEVAASMLCELGCSHVILGHSERRQYHSESDDLVGAKLSAAVTAGLCPILCVGETREQRESGEAEAVVAAQLLGALENQADLDNCVIAYEPVWAIGTGLTASAQQAQDMHAFIRERLQEVKGLDAEGTRILYGGSVKADNAAGLFAEADIDGALVGGASLKAEDFAAIVAAA